MVSGIGTGATRRFYDDLAKDYDQVYANWSASITRQGESLNDVLGAYCVGMDEPVLDCACGIGTQLIGLAALGRNVTGSDLSPHAVLRARSEAQSRGLPTRMVVADMQALPFRDEQFAAVICADNALPHLLTPASLAAGLAEIRRVLRPNGVLVVSTRDYDTARQNRTTSTAPSVNRTGPRTVITFQLWHWHDDGEHYDVEHFTLDTNDHAAWTVKRRNVTYWALTREQVTHALSLAGFTEPSWHQPPEFGFFQQLVTAKRPLSGATDTSSTEPGDGATAQGN